MINSAINSTLSRTVVTAATVFLVLVILFLFGGAALKGFSLALLIGIIAGTYSSICIATPVVVDFTSKKKIK
jgi:SecD/SecF fusion protein